MCVFLPAFSVTQATNSSDFFDKEVFSSWHSKQASSAHDLTKTFLSFLYLLHEYLAALNIAQVNLALYSFARYFRENGRLNHIRNEQGKSKERKNEERIRKWQRMSKEQQAGSLTDLLYKHEQHSTMW